MSTHGQEPGVDAPLRAALDHAPDHDLRPPAAVRAAVLRAAHAAASPRVAPWRRWLGLDPAWDWGSPKLWTAVASVAGVGLALNLAWHVSMTPEAAGDSAGADMRSAPAAPDTPLPAAKVAEAAPAAPPEPAPPATREERQRLDKMMRSQAHAPAAAPQAEKPRAPRATAVAPTIVATNVAPAPASAPQPSPPPSPAAPALAEAAAPRLSAQGAVADRRAELSVLPAKRGLADAAPAALGQVASSPWPEPLARLEPVLAADGDWPAGGWQVKALAGTAPPTKAWWRALLQASAGRWQAEPGPLPADAAAAPAWLVSAPDGSRFTLTLAGGVAWLQTGGAMWRAGPVPPLP